MPSKMAFFKRYLKIAPLSLALLRSTEAGYLSQVPLKRPILDIGCGFGEFGRVFFDQPADMGLDINYKDLIQSMKTKKYISLTWGDAKAMPFEDNSFNSIFSVSSLEHIKDVNKAIKEAFRVLKPGGILDITVSTNKVSDYIFYGPLLKKIGLKTLGDWYTNAYNGVFKHHSLLSREEWEKFITQAGFKIEQSKEIMSPAKSQLFDIFLITAWPAQVCQIIFRNRLIFRPQFMINFLSRIFSKFINEKEETGSALFIVAKKPK